jgi:hypothetical protein
MGPDQLLDTMGSASFAYIFGVLEKVAVLILEKSINRSS